MRYIRAHCERPKPNVDKWQGRKLWRIKSGKSTKLRIEKTID
jgi:hypothetical protein